MELQLRYKKLVPDVEPPTRAYGEPAGWDIAAYCISETGRAIQTVLPPRTTRLISTKLVVLPPPGHFLAVCSRSGLATHSIFVANAPGIIDSDYRGELKVILYNTGGSRYEFKHGDRIAQLVMLHRLLGGLALPISRSGNVAGAQRQAGKDDGNTHGGLLVNSACRLSYA